MTTLTTELDRVGKRRYQPAIAVKPRLSPALWRLVPVGLALAICSLVGYGIGRFPSLRGDEGIYTEQANAILHGSIAPYTYTYDHPFLGWTQISVLGRLSQLLHIGGSLSVVNVRAVMVLYAFVTSLLVYGIARRTGMRRAPALLAMALMGASPLFIVQSRQVLLDNIALPWVLGSFWLALTPTRRQWIYGLSGICFAVGALSKETVLLLLPVALFLVWRNCYRPLRAMSMIAFTTLGTLVIAFYPLFALLRNELFGGSGHVSIWDNEIKYQLLNRGGSGSLWQPHSARAQLLNGWLFYDHWLLIGGGVAAVLCFASSRLRFLGFAAVLWALPLFTSGGYLPAMYVIAVLPICGLAVAGVIDASYGSLTKHGPRRLLLPLATVATAAFVIPAGVSYAREWPRINTVGPVRADSQAMSYLTAHVSHRAAVLTDDAFFVDLQRAGFGGPWRGVSYYKFDLDPLSSHKNLPQGWQDINYVLSTPEMRANSAGPAFSNTQAAVKHATVIARFDAGTDSEVDVFRVAGTPYNSRGFGK